MSVTSTVTRRRFVAQASGLGLATALPLAAQSGRRPAPSNRLTFGCIGLGSMGNGNLGSFLGQPDCQVVAVCDVDRNRLAAAQQRVDQKYQQQTCRAYSDFRELLARDDIDCISLATPDHWHAIPAVLALAGGKDVYGEKPLTHSLAEGRAVADAQRRYGRIWQTGSWQRSVANFRWGAELVRNGRIGKVVKIEVGLPTGRGAGPSTFGPPPPELDYELWLGPAEWQPYCAERTHWNWRWQLAYGGGQLMDWIGHHGDIAQWGMGWDQTGPSKIVPLQAEFPTTGVWDAATTYSFVAHYPGVELHISNAIRGGTRWIGADGRWIWVTRGAQDANPRSLLHERVGPDEQPLYVSSNHQRNFVDSVLTRRPAITPAETAHRSASLGHLGLIALRLGRTLHWDPVRETFANDAGATQLLGHAARAPWRL
ncbi:MAG: Gfo/Idh/MocA family oxidoreductase [Fimbriimonadaceae bacterium]|nr:Gfo/Idh/MocA family oxidoreductase [Fimbriimonadaceae bacterium]